MRQLTPPPALPRLHRSLCAVSVVLTLFTLLSCKRSDMLTQQPPVNPSAVVYLEDSVITSRVRTALILSPVIRSFNISVESHSGVVLLSGMAADPTQIDLAIFVAQTVPGVVSVESFMFSIAPAAGSALRQSEPADLGLQGPAQRLDMTHHPVYPGLPAQSPTAGEPSETASGLYGVNTTAATTQGQDTDANAATPGMPRLSRWVTLAHSVLGIGSIQDELQIKR